MSKSNNWLSDKGLGPTETHTCKIMPSLDHRMYEYCTRYRENISCTPVSYLLGFFSPYYLLPVHTMSLLRSTQASGSRLYRGMCTTAVNLAQSASRGRNPRGENEPSQTANSASQRHTAKNVVSMPAAGSNLALPVVNNRRNSGPAIKRFYKSRNYDPASLNLTNLYAPRQRRAAPLLGPSRAAAEKLDPLFKLRLRPGHPSLEDDSYKNPVLVSSYVSEMGKILPRKDTNLTMRSQREVAKAIRRLRAMGLIPTMSRMRKGAW